MTVGAGRRESKESERVSRLLGKGSFSTVLKKKKKKNPTQIVTFVMQDRKILLSSCITRALSEDFKDGKDSALSNPTERFETFG